MSNTSPHLGTPPVPARPLPATRAASDAPAPVRTGHCQCGRTSYQVTGAPGDPHLCSCVHETRISGGPAVLWVGFPLDSLTWTGPGGEPKWYATYPTLRRGFCPACVMQAVRVSRDVVSHGWRGADEPCRVDRLPKSSRPPRKSWPHLVLRQL
ncbi:GFA family protein [Streptomyces nojiriensis]|uniref:GFA family protein n=1 Tax=Streptomyces nojiriensis TaxID=66374 RepID=UPI004063097F